MKWIEDDAKFFFSITLRKKPTLKFQLKTSMSGAVLDVVAKGPQDKFLTDQPTVSFFQTSYAQHTPFSRESVELQVSGQVAFGQTMIVPLNKRGDMLGKVYIVFRLPGIRHKSEPMVRRKRPYCAEYDDWDCSSTSTASSSTGSSSSSSRGTMPHKFVYWGNSIAYLALEFVSFQIGGQDVCKHFGEWLEINDEYTSKPGKPTDELVGRFRKEKDLWKASRRPQIRYAPLRFFFCEQVGKALPILAIHYSNVRLQIKTRDLHDCYYSSDGSIPYLIDSNQELCPRDLKVSVFANVYYLSEYERDEINDDEHEYLIQQVQYNGGQVIGNSCTAMNAPVTAKLPFQHPVIEIILTIQDERHQLNKDWFNYSGRCNEDPLASMKMTVNNHDRFCMREGKWFRLIEPLEHHTNIPRKHIYSYSFALFPEEQSFPSGSLNFSRLDDVTLHIVLQRGLGTCFLKVWALNHNVFRCLGGLAGLAYTG